MSIIKNFVRFVSVIAVLSGFGCSDPAAPVLTALNGTYVLKSLNGKVPPDTIAYSIPSGAPTGDPPCAMVITRGTLAFDAGSNTFSITVYVENACTGVEGVTATESGTYTQNGQSLSLVESAADPGRFATFNGQIDGQVITIHGADFGYTFAR
jgi:hypothetical protein